MSYGTQIKLMTSWIPQPLQNWLINSLPVIDLMAWYGEWRGFSVICISIDANDAQDLWLKREALNAMIEAQGYGPGANKK